MLGKQWNWWGVQQQWDWTGSLSTGGHPACALANPPVGRPFGRLLKPEFPISSTPTLLFPYSSTAMWIVPRMPWRLTNKQDVKVWSSFPRQRVFLYESDATQVVLTKIYHNISNSFKLTFSWYEGQSTIIFLLTGHLRQLSLILAFNFVPSQHRCSIKKIV